MIHFNAIAFKNFLSVGDQPTEIKLDKTITSIVTGVNGAGKSTFVDAIVYGLFGKPYRKVRLGQLINTVNEKGLEVEIIFTIGNKTYTVIRGMKPSKFEIWVNGEMIEQPAKTADYQNMLETDILKLNYNSFTQIIILGNAAFKPFMQLKLSDRREIIEDLLDITVFTDMNKILKAKTKDLKQEIVDVSHKMELNKAKHKTSREYLLDATENHQKRIETTKRYLRDANRNARLREIDMDGFKEYIDAIENSMLGCEGYEDVLTKITNEISNFEISIVREDSKYETFSRNVSVIQGIKEKIKGCLVGVNDNMEKIKKLNDVKKEIDFSISVYKINPNEKEDIKTKLVLIMSGISSKQLKLKFYEKNADCPECKQAIDAKFRDDAIEDLELEIKEAQQEYDGYEKRLAVVERDIAGVAELNEHHIDYDKSINEHQQKIDKLENSVDLMRTSLKTMEILSEDQLNILKSNIDSMKKRVYSLSAERVDVKEKHEEYVKLEKSHVRVLHDLDMETIKYNEYIATAIKLGDELETLGDTPECSINQEDIDLLARWIKELDQIHIKKKRMLYYYGIVQRLLKDDGIKTKIIKKFLPIINATVNMYLDKMDFPINFMFDENFNETIQSNFRNDFCYYSFSEGEKARIDLSLLFTWREVSLKKSRNATNIIIFDEIFDGSLDGAGIDNFMNILGLGEEYSSFIITHDEDVKTNEFDRNLDFTKDGHFSKLKES